MTDVSISAFTPNTGVSTVSGAEGTITVGRASAARTAGALPSKKLGCWWKEVQWKPIGGGATTTQLRPSTMGSLTLSSAGSYRTASVGGRFVREGDKVRFTTGPYAGAIGTLRPDNSGEPAVYFEKDENRTPAGEMLVDPNTTACTISRGG